MDISLFVISYLFFSDKFDKLHWIVIYFYAYSRLINEFSWHNSIGIYIPNECLKQNKNGISMVER